MLVHFGFKTYASTLVITPLAKWTYKEYTLTFTFAYENGSRHIEGDAVGQKAMYL